MSTSVPPAWGSDFETLNRENISLRKQVDHLSTLREIGLAISESLEINSALRIIARVVQGSLGVQRLTIYDLQEKGTVLRPMVAKYGDDLITQERLQEDSIGRNGTIFDETLQIRSVLLHNQGDHSEAYIPLIANDEPLGILHLQDYDDGRPFNDDDKILFWQLGSQIALAIHNAQLYALAVTDGLTGLFVRRYFDLRMEEEFAAAQRYDRPFSLLLFDIDHFKLFNDNHGHQTGDMVLKQFAILLEDNTRQSDICCRYGGEEMTVILPQTDLDEAALLANKLCTRIRKHVFIGLGEKELALTTSIGVAEYQSRFEGPGEMVRAADQALYEAKDLGRNRVELAGM
jgi:diguanylate cyclase (GGDEF)-like protein